MRWHSYSLSFLLLFLTVLKFKADVPADYATHPADENLPVATLVSTTNRFLCFRCNPVRKKSTTDHLRFVCFVFCWISFVLLLWSPLTHCPTFCLFSFASCCSLKHDHAVAGGAAARWWRYHSRRRSECDSLMMMILLMPS